MELYGNTSGLSPSATKTLERIYRRRVPSSDIATPELMRSLVDASVETGRQVGALVHRSGEVDYVVVGDAGKLMLPDIGRLRAAEGRFRGLRLVHTHVRGEPLTRDDLVDLVRLRLDLVCAIQLSPRGEARSLHYAYNVPSEGSGLPYRDVGPLPIAHVDVDVAELMADLETEFAKRTRAREVQGKDGRAILVHIGEKSERDALRSATDRVRELRELAYSAGVEVVDVIVQIRDRIDPRLVLGKGKLDDVIVRAMQLDASVLIFDRELTPTQSSAIAKESDLKVIDRTQLILDIFAQRAESKDGKLQVELAQLKYNMPRLVQKDDSLSRLTGGIGGRGPGETKLEIGRRRAKERVSHLEAQLKKLAAQREQRRRKRTRGGVPTIAVVGYTNAGKSTLLNTLTNARATVLAEDKLFATLDTRSRTLEVGWAGYGDREVVITDTVGFIRELPKDLFAAFRATFEEAADADLILHVVDASDEARDDHIRTTEEVLAELELDEIPRILVFNKMDLVAPFAHKLLEKKQPDAIFLSASQRETTRPLLVRIARDLQERWHESAKVPDPPPTEEDLARDLAEEDALAGHADQGATLDELLRMGGRRVKRSAPRTGQ
ncbi:MAG: GTPase HflX [Labilithrix sp.]|nr:GTPase HflX [Labilithrix sp.]